MKRIIDGVTYNTATSTLLATSEYETEYNHNDRPCEAKLYQTLGGAFFVHEAVDLGYDREEEKQDWRHRFIARSYEQAHAWIMNGDVEIIHNPFDEPPEAVAENEPGATIYVRVPMSLKRRLEAAAKTDKMSGNTWAMRCVERCLASNHDEGSNNKIQNLKRYLEEKLPSNDRGEITPARLREALLGIVEMTNAW